VWWCKHRKSSVTQFSYVTAAPYLTSVHSLLCNDHIDLRTSYCLSRGGYISLQSVSIVSEHKETSPSVHLCAIWIIFSYRHRNRFLTQPSESLSSAAIAIAIAFFSLITARRRSLWRCNSKEEFGQYPCSNLDQQWQRWRLIDTWIKSPTASFRKRNLFDMRHPLSEFWFKCRNKDCLKGSRQPWITEIQTIF
jgi:hypothetical protein